MECFTSTAKFCLRGLDPATQQGAFVQADQDCDKDRDRDSYALSVTIVTSFVHTRRGATDDNSPPLQRWEKVEETTGQSWKDVRKPATQDRPSFQDWDTCLPNRDPAINR